MADRKVHVPGAEEPQLPEIAAQLNNTDTDPNDMAAQHEARVATATAADLMAKGDIEGAMEVMKSAGETTKALAAAGPALVDEAPRVAAGVFGDEVERVSMPAISRNSDVAKYGRETAHPSGTQLDVDMNPVTGNAEPAYYVGSLLIKGRGWLINRAIPIEGGPADPNRPPPLAADAA